MNLTSCHYQIKPTHTKSWVRPSSSYQVFHKSSILQQNSWRLLVTTLVHRLNHPRGHPHLYDYCLVIPQNLREELNGSLVPLHVSPSSWHTCGWHGSNLMCLWRAWRDAAIVLIQGSGDLENIVKYHWGLMIDNHVSIYRNIHVYISYNVYIYIYTSIMY